MEVALTVAAMAGLVVVLAIQAALPHTEALVAAGRKTLYTLVLVLFSYFGLRVTNHEICTCRQ